jgi:ribosome biogenesis GTPase
MSKRRISHQQAKRIQRKQTRYQQQVKSLQPESLLQGFVIKRFSRLALIENVSGQRFRCAIRPEIESLVAGDEVIWQPESELQGVVISRQPRKSVLSRPDCRGVLKAVAANITQVIIVVAPKPEISWSLLDSYLVITETLNLRTQIVLNKTDIDEGRTCKNQLEQIYTPIGYPILQLSREEQSSQSLLQQALQGQTSVFVGQSGVGKSSIIAHLLPEITGIQTNELSATSNLGRHTTSNSCLYHLPSGGHLIDSPGVREFGLWDMPPRDIAKGFREFHPYLAECQFRNCNHQNAPGCAIQNALQAGVVHSSRFLSFSQLVNQMAGRNR